jgi:hypothetical protein
MVPRLALAYFAAFRICPDQEPPRRETLRRDASNEYGACLAPRAIERHSECSSGLARQLTTIRRAVVRMSDPQAFVSRGVFTLTRRGVWLFLVVIALLIVLAVLGVVVMWYQSVPAITREGMRELLRSSTPEAVVSQMGQPCSVQATKRRDGSVVYDFEYEYRLAPGGDCVVVHVRIDGDAVSANASERATTAPGWRLLSAHRSVSFDRFAEIVQSIGQRGMPVETILRRLGCPDDIGTSRLSGERAFVFTYSYRVRRLLHASDCAWIVVTSYPTQTLVTPYGPRPCAAMTAE